MLEKVAIESVESKAKEMTFEDCEVLENSEMESSDFDNKSFLDELLDGNPELEESDFFDDEEELVFLEELDARELTKEEVKVLQDDGINEVESGERVPESNAEKGAYAEMKTDRDLALKGYKRINTPKDVMTSLDTKGHQGIDGVYENPNGKPRYLIVDAKYGVSPLSTTKDGKQMSEGWIDKRLDIAVGKEKAQEIRNAQLKDPDSVGSYVAKVTPEGSITYNALDKDAKTIEKDVKIGE